MFEHPGLAKELWTVHMLNAGDLDARYVGSRATLEPLFASYGMPANSDYAPVLDLNAARARFTEKDAGDIVALLNLEVPVLELLEPARSRRALNPLFRGAYAFERIENTRLAWYARDFLVGRQAPSPEAVPTQLQKDLELVRLRLLECRQPRDLDVWLHSALRVARALNPYLAPDDAGAVWMRIAGEPVLCLAAGVPAQLAGAASRGGAARRRAHGRARHAAARDADRPAQRSARVPADGGHDRPHRRWRAAAGRRLWRAMPACFRPRRAASPAFRLLRCQAGPGCAEAFAAYAGR